MPNRLANESSPYLLQHANNPVDWYPWGDEAIGRSRDEDKPIFLSIGYSACHWCHVMEHESFESEAISSVLNERFISIKVDREERPDLDQIYMNAVQLMTGRGGWPMSVFLLPDLRPFYGGTYWPPTGRMGMPGFDQVLSAVFDAWENRRDQALQQATELTNRIASIGDDIEVKGNVSLDQTILLESVAKLESAFDFTNGGFGGAPKFPHSMDLQMLLRVWRRTKNDGIMQMIRISLDKMAGGGIYDHLAGGFARYSVDDRWLVPHFEKMLYDNALLTQAYLDGYLATNEPRYKQVVLESLDYIEKYMTDPCGAFHSTEDADSEGEEGKFYVWTPDEVTEILGEELSERYCYVYQVTEHGNFEGKNILNLPKSIEQCAAAKGWDAQELKDELRIANTKLLAVRDQRIRPAKDDKILVSWNGLMIDAMAQAGSALAEPRFVKLAENAANFILNSMRDSNGRLLHTWRNGEAKILAYLDDYACLANSLVSLYAATFQENWLADAIRLMEIVLEDFQADGGALYYTSTGHEQLIARTKDLYDSSVPSGNAMAATALIRIGKLCGRADFVQMGEQIIKSARAIIKSSPHAAGQMLIALDLLLDPTFEVAIVGGEDQKANLNVIDFIRQNPTSNCLYAFRQSDPNNGSAPLNSLFEGRTNSGSEPIAFICQNFSCREPIAGATAIIEALGSLA